MSGRGRGSVGRGRGQLYSDIVGSGDGRGDGGRGRGRWPAVYNDPPPAPSVSTLTRDVATKLNIQSSGTTSASSSQPSSSSAPASTPPRLKEDESSVQRHIPPPASSKSMRIPSRPDYGTDGWKYNVKANHFSVKLDSNKDIHHYDVTITPAITSKKVSRRIIRQLVFNFKQSHLGNRILAYDGRKSAYTAGPLPFTSEEFSVELADGARRQNAFKVSIKFAAKVDLHHLLVFPQGTIQALDVVLRETPSAKYETVGRSFFSSQLGTNVTIGELVEYWKGFYQSLRPTQMGLSLNIDISAKPFYKPILVTEFIAKFLKIGDLKEAIPDQDFVEVKRALRGVIVETDHLGYVKRQKVTRFTNNLLRDLSFRVNKTGANVSVVQYFHRKHQIKLKYGFLPAFQYGTDSKPMYLPMEICKIAPYQRYTRKLSVEQNTAISKAIGKTPVHREENIIGMVRKNSYNSDNFGKQFGVQVKPQLTSFSARVLPCPTLKYHETGEESRVKPEDGQWNMKNKKMVNGGRVNFWTCVNFSERCPSYDAELFCERLLKMCRSKGMVFSQSFLPVENGDPGQIENCLVDIHNQSSAQFKSMGLDGKILQLLIVILPDISGSYGTIKRVCETKLGIVSQCCQPEKALKPKMTYLENVALKINVKVGGRNTVLEEIPFETDVPTIIFGADVTHPRPGEDSSPSIAAVVGSMDWPEVTKYRGLVSAQKRRQQIIQDLYKKTEDPHNGDVHSGMIRELLLAFYHSNSHLKPGRIIFYRDGVGEGQFNQVLLEERDAIGKACKSLEEGYQPPVTFIVVQKRHNTRLFPDNHSGRDESGNILPGTVVDTKICHPKEFDFFLCSHAGIKGTSRPIHYHVLCDENNFSANALQKLTNNLCYTYARCTRSVSIVPPVYYAYLAAKRASYYVEGEASSSSEIPKLPPIKKNVQEVMFYC